MLIRLSRVVVVVGAGQSSPSSEAHLGLFGGEKVPEQKFRRPHHNQLTSINAKIDHRDDGSVLIA